MSLKTDGWPAGYDGFPPDYNGPTTKAGYKYGTLVRAVARALDRGARVPCLGRDEWTSDDYRDRREAATACAPCPVLAQCDDTATTHRPLYGVYAGRDWVHPVTRQEPVR